MIELKKAIKSLSENNVDFVIVGGVALKLHSSAYVTLDLDFCYARTKENFAKIVSALAPFKPRPRDFPDDLLYFFDERSLQNTTNFTFQTSIGDIDLLGEVAGVGTYSEVKLMSDIFELYGYDVQVLSIRGLIKAKRAAGRTKDLLVLPELEALREALSDDED